MGSNRLSLQMAEEAMDSWDPSATEFVWPSSGGEESNSRALESQWANDPFPLTSQWNTIDEDTVLFGDYSSLGVEQLYAEGVIVDSCLSGRNGHVQAEDGSDDDDHDEFAGDHEEQLQFFEGAAETPAPVAEKIKEEEKDAAEESTGPGVNLQVKIERHSGEANESAVSTPEVLNDLLSLENEGLFRKAQATDNFIKIEAESDYVLEYIEEENADYEEFVIEYVEESLIEPNPASSQATIDDSYTNTEFEDDDKDADYQPPPTKASKRSSRLSSIASSTTSGHSGYYGKRRGRPPKPLRTSLTARELANLDPKARLEKEMRFKNNEASRLSRYKRRQRDLKLSDQCERFESENKSLRRILKQHKRLHNQLRGLIVGVKFLA